MFFPYGAQYYRTPNPPESEWDKDFAEMARQGFTIAKIWAMWSYIHTDEDSFDFTHFDHLFKIADKHGIKLMINTILENAPYWLAAKYPDARYTASDGQKFSPIARANTPGGGWPGLCWDNKEVVKRAEKFLKAVGARYADSDILWGYDVWNEVFCEPKWYPGFENRFFCYCPGSISKFVEWLKAKYGSLDALCDAWYRRYTDWIQVYPPPYVGGYPDWIDWMKFRMENNRDQMRWRVETLRSVDPNHPLTSHGIGNTLNGMPTHLLDDFEIAQEVDIWGLTNFPSCDCPRASDHTVRLDLVRSACAAVGKRFWQTELQGGQQGDGIRRGLIPRAIDTSFWNWCAFSCGAKGLLYWQWRPEMLGPESPGYGLCRLDGSPTDRTDAASSWARFMQAHPELSDAMPTQGDVAILVLPESQLFDFAGEGSTASYAGDMYGTYRALWEANVMVDFIKIDRIEQYPLVFLPFPLMIEAKNSVALKNYVAGGGTLISHACPGHFKDHGYTSVTVPGMGLDELFGAVEDETEYLHSLEAAGRELPSIVRKAASIPCSIYQERLTVTTGREIARFSDGSIAIVDSDFGKGRGRLIGTFPGLTYWRTSDPEAASLIRDSLVYAGIQQMIEVSEPEIHARIQSGPSGTFLWVVNTHWAEKDVEVRVDGSIGTISGVEELTDGLLRRRLANSLIFSLPPRDGAIVRLEFR